MKLATVEDMRFLQTQTEETAGIPELLLMENAGVQLYNGCLKYLKKKSQVVIIAGKGTNGGDGFVCARHLVQNGYEVRLFLLHSPTDFENSTKANWSYLEAMDMRWYALKDKNSFYTLKLALETCDLAVDAMCGLGFYGELAGSYLEACKALNDSPAPILCCDVPTGLNATTGALDPGAVKATETITFGLAKQGLFLYPGKKNAGKVSIAPISIPQSIVDQIRKNEYLVEEELIKDLLPTVERDSYKGTFGHVLGIAGSLGMTGAALLSSQAALRSGAGLASVMVDKAMALPFDLAVPEVMTVPIKDYVQAVNLAEKYDAIYVGPGIAHREDLAGLLKDLMVLVCKPMVIDGAGLWALAQDPGMVLEKGSSLILTPHPGEMSVLLGKTVDEIQKDRVAAVRECARLYSATVVLKGSTSLICSETGDVYVNPTASPSLATAGSGDVLTGIISAFLAQGLEPLDSAVLGVYLHGLCGERLEEKLGERGALAGDIMKEIPLAVKELRDKWKSLEN